MYTKMYTKKTTLKNTIYEYWRPPLSSFIQYTKKHFINLTLFYNLYCIRTLLLGQNQ